MVPPFDEVGLSNSKKEENLISKTKDELVIISKGKCSSTSYTVHEFHFSNLITGGPSS